MTTGSKLREVTCIQIFREHTGIKRPMVPYNFMNNPPYRGINNHEKKTGGNNCPWCQRAIGIYGENLRSKARYLRLWDQATKIMRDDRYAAARMKKKAKNNGI